MPIEEQAPIVGVAISKAEAHTVEGIKATLCDVQKRIAVAKTHENQGISSFTSAFSALVSQLLTLKTEPHQDGAILFLDEEQDSSAVAKALGETHKVLKADEEERYILGIVLEPLKDIGSKDLQNDTYSAEEVRKSAYKFLEEYGNIGLQHKEYVTGRIKIRENWVTREDTTINGQFVHKGTWLLGVHVIDDALWADVKAGKFTGFSIGGWANQTRID